ncbi:MAG: lysine--tRNA ligase, partial [Archaeoglobus sp.]
MHWADKVAEELLRRGDKHRIATGITPSGHIHLGNLREMLTADAVRRALEDRGGKVKIIYIADTFDPLRKRYPFLPAEYDKYVGMPLSRIPCPCGEHKNYAEHF